MWRCFHYAELASTNDTALALAAAGAGEKYAVSADRQTAGRGRRGRIWQSGKGNLFLSLALPFADKEGSAPVFVSSLALFAAVKSLDASADLALKWPNDVLLAGKKMSGILLERGKNDYMVIGIGVNLESAPAKETVLYPTTCLADAGITVTPAEFAKIYLRCFDEVFALWEKEGLPPLVEKWQTFARGLGQSIVVRLPKTEKTGLFAGLADDGALILQTAEGMEKITAGEVFFGDEAEK